MYFSDRIDKIGKDGRTKSGTYPGKDDSMNNDSKNNNRAKIDGSSCSEGKTGKEVQKRSTSLMGSGILLLTAFIWGMAFVAQSTGMDHVEPFTMNCSRSILGGLTLLPVILWQRLRARRLPAAEGGAERIDHGATIIGGICCGVILAVASALQQIGICYTTVGKAGFITTLYIVMVPLAGIFWKRKVSGRVWISVALAALGMYLLCMNESFTVNPGDLYVFGCAIAFTGHILVIDHFSPKADCVAMSCIQFFTCALVSGIGMFLFEEPAWVNIRAAAVPILYAGVMSSGVAYTLQIVGQKRTEPVVASLIMSLESVFAVLGGWLLLNQRLSGKEMLGCAVVFAGIILVQLPEKKG